MADDKERDPGLEAVVVDFSQARKTVEAALDLSPALRDAVLQNPVSHRSSVSAREQETQAKPAVESDGGASNRAPDGRA